MVARSADDIAASVKVLKAQLAAVDEKIVDVYKRQGLETPDKSTCMCPNRITILFFPSPVKLSLIHI